MNLDVLDETLQRLGIPTTLVSLGHHTDSAWCVVPSDGHWEVYWCNQAVKHSRADLTDEATACYFLLGRLVHDQVLAGEFELPG